MLKKRLLLSPIVEIPANIDEEKITAQNRNKSDNIFDILNFFNFSSPFVIK